MLITDLEANLLLSALDNYLGVDKDGKLQSTEEFYSLKDVQYLRDRLFKHHKHPEQMYKE